MAILYAREGAYVTIVYLPQEQEDANETKRIIEKEGKKCLTLPFDLTDVNKVKSVVDEHLKKYGALDIPTTPYDSSCTRTLQKWILVVSEIDCINK